MKFKYHDPGYDDLSIEEFWDHLKYENAETLGMKPSEMEEFSVSELEEMLEEEKGSPDYEETYDGLVEKVSNYLKSIF